jgi:SPP1 gp7 family putative phage head morphogenesis protein
MLKEAKGLVDEQLGPMLPSLVAAAAAVHDAIAPRSYADTVAEALEKIASSFFEKFPAERLRQLARSMAQRTSELQRAELTRQLAAGLGRQIAVDVFSEPGIPARLEAFAAANVQLVKNVPQRFFDDVSARVVQGLRTGERAEDLQAEIQDRYQVSESRARLIARDQVGKLYGELAQARQENLGIDAFTWRTSEDERVRPEHEELDGKKFAWSDPPSEGIPGEPINCRCTAEPDVASIFEAL